jgi:hypothetical protein
MPVNSFPYVLIEHGGIEPTERKGFKSFALYFSIGVENKTGAAVKEINRVASELANWLSTTRFKNAVSMYPDSIQFSIGTRGSQFIGTRYADITVSAVVQEQW